MRTEKVVGKDITVAFYNDVADLARSARIGRDTYQHNPAKSWAGGTIETLEHGLTAGDHRYTKRAKALAQTFNNIDLEPPGVDLEWNPRIGVLDYHAAMAGQPMCMYGPDEVPTPRAPINIFTDTWTRADIKPACMERRGLAILLLTMALAIYRPVSVYLVKGSKFVPNLKDTVQIVKLPDINTDLGRHAFALCSPTINRCAMLGSIHHVHKSSRSNPSFGMSDPAWQLEGMPAWFAERSGMAGSDFIHFGPTTGVEPWYKDDAATVAWVRAQIDKWVAKSS